MTAHFAKWLAGLGLGETFAKLTAVVTGVVLLAILAYAVNIAAKRLLLRIVNLLVARTETTYDDAFVNRGVFSRLANLAPALVLYLLAPVVFSLYPTVGAFVQRVTMIFMIIVGLLAINGAMIAANDIYSTFSTSRKVPLKGLFQVITVVIYLVGGIVILGLVLDKTPLYLLSGLGALTAVLLIVFKDPILGFVAGVQLSANDMVAIDDWIEMPSHNADGDVIEVALTTVKVRNWDKTITTLPTYDLITKPFRNWRGMREIGGRRIARAINIDMKTVRFLDDKLLERLGEVALLRDYLAEKKTELEQANQQLKETWTYDERCDANGRRLTNLGTFRAYLIAYLKNHPKLRKDLTLLVRQQAPSEYGIPIQIYAFTDTTAWAEYEGVQADIFDHLLAVVPLFDLRVFQTPAGGDVQDLVGHLALPKSTSSGRR
jgi:miniconductance mechanosensitive channel